MRKKATQYKKILVYLLFSAGNAPCWIGEHVNLIKNIRKWSWILSAPRS